MNFYSSPKSLLAISVRQGRQQLLVITGSPSLLLSVGERRDGREGGREKTCSRASVYIYLYISLPVMLSDIMYTSYSGGLETSAGAA